MKKLNLLVLTLFSLFPVNCGGVGGGGDSETYEQIYLREISYNTDF